MLFQIFHLIFEMKGSTYPTHKVTSTLSVQLLVLIEWGPSMNVPTKDIFRCSTTAKFASSEVLCKQGFNTSIFCLLLLESERFPSRTCVLPSPQLWQHPLICYFILFQWIQHYYKDLLNEFIKIPRLGMVNWWSALQQNNWKKSAADLSQYTSVFLACVYIINLISSPESHRTSWWGLHYLELFLFRGRFVFDSPSNVLPTTEQRKPPMWGFGGHKSPSTLAISKYTIH